MQCEECLPIHINIKYTYMYSKIVCIQSRVHDKQLIVQYIVKPSRGTHHIQLSGHFAIFPIRSQPLNIKDTSTYRWVDPSVHSKGVRLYIHVAEGLLCLYVKLNKTYISTCVTGVIYNYGIHTLRSLMIFRCLA